MARPSTDPPVPRKSDCNESDENVLADAEDLASAKNDIEIPRRKPWYKAIGPGLITGAADDDPSGIGTYSQSGASFGYGQLWLVPFRIPLMIAIQEMCGRVGLVTATGIAAVIKRHYGKWLLYGTLLLLVAGNTLNVFADLNVMAASAKMLFGFSQTLWLTLIAASIITLQILVPYKKYARILKFTCLALVGYAVVALMPGLHSDWPKIFRSRSSLPGALKQTTCFRQ